MNSSIHYLRPRGRSVTTPNAPTQSKSFISRLIIAMHYLFGGKSNPADVGSTDTSPTLDIENSPDLLDTHFGSVGMRTVMAFFSSAEINTETNTHMLRHLLSYRVMTAFNNLVLRNMADYVIKGFTQTSSAHTCEVCEMNSRMVSHNLTIAPQHSEGLYKLLLVIEHVNTITEERHEVSIHMVFTLDRNITEKEGVTRVTITQVFPEKMSNSVMAQILAYGSDVVEETAKQYRGTPTRVAPRRERTVVPLREAPNE